MSNLHNVLISKDINSLTKVWTVMAMVFPVVTYCCDSWTIKKAESWRIDAFELWCWRRLLREDCKARRSDQSVLKEINPEYPMEVLMLKLQLQYFGHRMRTADSLEWLGIGVKAGDEGDRGWDGWMMRWLNSIIDSTDLNLGKIQEMARNREAWHDAVHGGAKNETQFHNWTASTTQVA